MPFGSREYIRTFPASVGAGGQSVGAGGQSVGAGGQSVNLDLLLAPLMQTAYVSPTEFSSKMSDIHRLTLPCPRRNLRMYKQKW